MRLEGKVYLKCSPWTVQGYSEGILSGETPVSHAGHGESSQTSAPTAGIVQGVSPKGWKCYCQLCWAQGHLPQAECRYLGELISTSFSSLPSSPTPVTISGLGMSLTECPSLQSCVLSVLCSPAWQIKKAASPGQSSLHLCVVEMKIPACFFTL